MRNYDKDGAGQQQITDRRLSRCPARLKVLAFMHAQEAKGIYPFAWESPDWDEYMRELFNADD